MASRCQDASDLKSEYRIDSTAHPLPGIHVVSDDVDVALEDGDVVADGVTNACMRTSSALISTGPVLSDENMQAASTPRASASAWCRGATRMSFPFVTAPRSGHLLSLANSRYVLVEPPTTSRCHGSTNCSFNPCRGDVPVPTHPERLRG